MSLLNLTTETMVTLSARWLDPKRLRNSLTALPLIVPLLPVLQQVHDDLISKQRTTSAAEKELADLQAEETRRDARHDRKVRGVHGFLSGLADLTDDPEAARALLDLRDRLLPIGIQAVTRSYVDEAGDAERLPARLDAAAKALLAKLQTPDGPLQVHVDAWIEEAKQLGVLEERREHLAEQIAGGAGGPTGAEVASARHAWIRVVRAIESNLALDSKADPATVEKILGPLQRAEAKADRRRGASKDGGADDAADTVDLAPEPEATPVADESAEPADAVVKPVIPINPAADPKAKPNKP